VAVWLCGGVVVWWCGGVTAGSLAQALLKVAFEGPVTSTRFNPRNDRMFVVCPLMSSPELITLSSTATAATTDDSGGAAAAHGGNGGGEEATPTFTRQQLLPAEEATVQSGKGRLDQG
jgi:hypothetical protein